MEARSSDRLWLIPLAYGIGAVLVGVGFPRLESLLFPEFMSPISSDSAVAIFSSIAAGMMSLTAIVFSLVFIMVQFNATAYSPRLALWLACDPLMFHGIGIFTATFLYALVALAWVNRAKTGGVPWLTTINVFLLVMISVVTMARLVQRISLLKITNVLAYAESMGRNAAEKIYAPIGSGVGSRESNRDVDLPPVWSTVAYEGEPKVVQSFDLTALVREATDNRIVIEILAGVGDTVTGGEPLFLIRGVAPYLLRVRLQSTINLAATRAFDTDARCALRVLVDIAIKALSPAVNDPTTAVQSLDYIQSLLACIGSRNLTDGCIRDDSGALRLIYPTPTWEDFVSLACEEIRTYGCSSIQVVRRMRALFRTLLLQLPDDRQVAIRAQLGRLDGVVLRNFPTPEDLNEAQGEDRQGLGRSRVAHAAIEQVDR